MCCTVRVWKLKTSINSLHLLDLEAPGGPNSNGPKTPGGSAETNQTPQDRSILRVWKLKTLINLTHLLDLEAPGGPASNDAKGPGGSA